MHIEMRQEGAFDPSVLFSLLPSLLEREPLTSRNKDSLGRHYKLAGLCWERQLTQRFAVLWMFYVEEWRAGEAMHILSPEATPVTQGDLETLG